MDSRRCRVLIVEDDPRSARSMQLLLEMSGFEVRVAYDGAAGLELLAPFEPEVILSDIDLDGSMNGLTLARAVRSRGSRALLIAISGHSEKHYGDACRGAGFDHHFRKPTRMDEVERTIEDWLARRGAVDGAQSA